MNIYTSLCEHVYMNVARNTSYFHVRCSVFWTGMRCGKDYTLLEFMGIKFRSVQREGSVTALPSGPRRVKGWGWIVLPHIRFKGDFSK